MHQRNSQRTCPASATRIRHRSRATHIITHTHTYSYTLSAQESDALDDRVGTMVAAAAERGVPVVICLNRRRLGKVCCAHMCLSSCRLNNTFQRNKPILFIVVYRYFSYDTSFEL